MQTVTIIIPVYNVIAFLEKCVKSAIGQTYRDIEVILIDDGSTDGSEELCDRLAEQDKRISVVHTPNGGAAKARNTGLDLARGQYIMFVDADDYLAPNACEKMMWAILDCEADCVICGHQVVYDRNEYGAVCATKSLQMMTGLEAIKNRILLGKSEISIVEPWGKLFKKEMWNNIRFTDGLYYEDLDIMPYLYHNCKRIALIPDIGYYYYQRIGSASRGSGTDNKRYTDSVLIRKKHIQFYRAIGEIEMAEEVTKMLLDLIMTSACKGWIPDHELQGSQKAFVEYAKTIMKSARVSFKGKIRYSLFGLLGAKMYRKLIEARNG